MILLSAFEPFGNSPLNASLEVGQRLASRNSQIELLTLPVVRYEAQQQVLDRLQKGPTPDLFIALGEAGPKKVIRLEKVAINWDDYRIKDNGGNQPHDEAIIPGGADAYFATLPITHLADTLHEQTPVPVIISLSAGAFLCNHLAYAVSHHLTQYPICPFGFIHVPSWRPRRGKAALNDIVTTLEAIIMTALNTPLA